MYNIMLTRSQDSYGNIITETLIPAIRKMRDGWVQPAFVDQLLWIPSETGWSWLKCSNIEQTDQVFGNVKKK
jgi:hypothetical protein